MCPFWSAKTSQLLRPRPWRLSTWEADEAAPHKKPSEKVCCPANAVAGSPASMPEAPASLMKFLREMYGVCMSVLLMKLSKAMAPADSYCLFFSKEDR